MENSLSEKSGPFKVPWVAHAKFLVTFDSSSSFIEMPLWTSSTGCENFRSTSMTQVHNPIFEKMTQVFQSWSPTGYCFHLLWSTMISHLLSLYSALYGRSLCGGRDTWKNRRKKATELLLLWGYPRAFPNSRGLGFFSFNMKSTFSAERSQFLPTPPPISHEQFQLELQKSSFDLNFFDPVYQFCQQKDLMLLVLLYLWKRWFIQEKASLRCLPYVF